MYSKCKDDTWMRARKPEHSGLTTSRVASVVRIPDGPVAFTPVRALSNDSTAPITLIALSNHVRFAQPVHDPWFSATIPRVTHSDNTGNVTEYVSTFPMTILGCVEQF